MFDLKHYEQLYSLGILVLQMKHTEKDREQIYNTENLPNTTGLMLETGENIVYFSLYTQINEELNKTCLWSLHTITAKSVV